MAGSLGVLQMGFLALTGLSSPTQAIPGARRLLHAVGKAGGSRFTVGSTVRHPPGKSDAANKARLHHFKALHKICFYDAWRSEPVLNREDLPVPAPGTRDATKRALSALCNTLQYCQWFGRLGFDCAVFGSLRFSRSVAPQHK